MSFGRSTQRHAPSSSHVLPSSSQRSTDGGSSEMQETPIVGDDGFATTPKKRSSNREAVVTSPPNYADVASDSTPSSSSRYFRSGAQAEIIEVKDSSLNPRRTNTTTNSRSPSANYYSSSSPGGGGGVRASIATDGGARNPYAARPSPLRYNTRPSVTNTGRPVTMSSADFNATQSMVSIVGGGVAGGAPSNSLPTTGGAEFYQLTPWDKPLGWVPTVLLVLFMTVVAFALCAALAFDDISDMLLMQYVGINSESSPLFNTWRDPSSRGIATMRKFTVFNVTNADDVVRNGAVPSFSLLGPYCYKELSVKDDIRFTATKAHVKYRYRSDFVFDASGSVWQPSDVYGSALAPPRDNPQSPQYAEEDEVVVPSMGLIGFFHRLGLMPDTLVGNMTKSDVCDRLAAALSAEPIGPNSAFVRVKVKSLLFGYEDALLSMATGLLAGQHYYMPTAVALQWGGQLSVPSPYTHRSGQLCPLPSDNASVACNTTLNLDTTEGTGLYDHREMGAVTRWAGQRQTWWWGPTVDWYTGGNQVAPLPPQPAVEPTGAGVYPSPYSSVLPGIVTDQCPLNLGIHGTSSSGTNGMKFAPLNTVSRHDPLPVFADVAWRSFKLQFMGDSNATGASGEVLPTLRFHLPQTETSNSDVNKRCHQQYYDGILNFSQPLFSPIFGAQGFFYGVNTRANFSEGDSVPSSRLINITLRFPFGGWPDNTSATKPVFLRTDLPDYLTTEVNPFNAANDFESHTFLDVDPDTGLTTRTNLHSMLLTEIQPFTVGGGGCEAQNANGAFAKSSVGNLTHTLVPLLMIHKTTAVPADMIDEILEKKTKLKHARTALWVTSAMGFVGLFSVIGIVVFHRRRSTMLLAMDEDYATPLVKERASAAELH